MAPSGETHPRQSPLGAPHCWHGDRVTHVPTVPAHSPAPSALPGSADAAQGSCHPTGLPGNHSIPRSQQTTTTQKARLDSAVQHLPCAEWALPAPSSSRVGKHSRGGMGESVQLRGCALGTWHQHPVPPELGHSSPIPWGLIQGPAVHPWELPKLCLCAAEGPLSIKGAARPPQDFAFGPGHQQGALQGQAWLRDLGNV